MSNYDKLIEIYKNGINVFADPVGAQIASIQYVNSYGDTMEIMNQGQFYPEGYAYGKTATNLVMTPGPAARFNKRTLESAQNYKGEEMPVIKGTIRGDEVNAVATKYNNYPTLAVEHGWSQFVPYTIQGGGKANDDYFVLVNGKDKLSPFKYRHHVACSIEDDGSIKYTTELSNNGNAPIPGGLGWHPVFNLHNEPERFIAVFEDVVPENKDFPIEDGFVIDCKEIINRGGVKIKGFKSATVALYYVDNKMKLIPYLKVSSKCPTWVLCGKDGGLVIGPWNTDKTRVYEQITNQNDLSFLSDKGYNVLMPGESSSIETTIRICQEYVKYKYRHVVDEKDNNRPTKTCKMINQGMER